LTRLALARSWAHYLGKLSPEFIERLGSIIERSLPDLFIVETEFLSATSALELRVAARPGERPATLMAAIPAANNLHLAVVEWASEQAAYSIGQDTSTP